MMKTNNQYAHPWKITAPWYRWQKAGVPDSGRKTKPVLQKFSNDDFLNEFLKDPQHSLKFNNNVDRIYEVNYIAADPGQFIDKVASLFPVKENGKPFNKGDTIKNLRKSQLVETGMRKIYLPSHSRYYLVVCELHCDIPGFPSVDAEKVCQAGFVVRCQRLNYSEEARPEALTLMHEIIVARAKLSELDETMPLRPGWAKRRAKRIARMRQKGTYDEAHKTAMQAIEANQKALKDWQVKYGVQNFKEGWVPSEHKGIGQWQKVEETPKEIQEAWFPLYRLHADPNRPTYDARGRAIYFGVLPTSALEVTTSGESRFDDESIYEIRCFFRRHNPHCPRQGLNIDAPDCNGDLIWSESTEPYRLASQFDLLGTANRPVTIQMPNLAELAAQATARPIGRFSPVRFVQPQTLQPKIDGTSLGGGSMGDKAICFFSIPLITIVALFVLNLFLPIVVFIFNLWFLLALKFCIPPSIKIDSGLQTELAAIPPQIGIDAELQVDVDAPGFELEVEGSVMNGVEINTQLVDDLSTDLAEAFDTNANQIQPGLQQYSNAPLVSLSNVFKEQSDKQANEANPAGSSLNLTSDLEYEPRRICQWKYEKYLPTTGEFT